MDPCYSVCGNFIKSVKNRQNCSKGLLMSILVNTVITVSTNGYTQQKIGYILFVSQSEIYVSETNEV